MLRTITIAPKLRTGFECPHSKLNIWLKIQQSFTTQKRWRQDLYVCMFTGSAGLKNRARVSHLAVWQAVNGVGQPESCSGLGWKPEVLWRLAERRNLLDSGWWECVFSSSARRLTSRGSVEDPIQRYGKPFKRATPLILPRNRPFRHALSRLMTKQGNLLGTGRITSKSSWRNLTFYVSYCREKSKKL